LVALTALGRQRARSRATALPCRRARATGGTEDGRKKQMIARLAGKVAVITTVGQPASLL
jgi:hypothetical protein